MRVGTIVVGYDGSPDSCAALDAAIDHVAPGGAVHVVTVLDDRTLTEIERMLRDVPPDLRDRSPARLEPEAVLRRCLADARLLTSARGIAHHGYLLEGEAAAVLLDITARLDADLIAIGCHGLGPDRRFMRGSVAARVAHHSPSSVFIARHHDSVGPSPTRAAGTAHDTE